MNSKTSYFIFSTILLLLFFFYDFWNFLLCFKWFLELIFFSFFLLFAMTFFYWPVFKDFFGFLRMVFATDKKKFLAETDTILIGPSHHTNIVYEPQ